MEHHIFAEGGLFFWMESYAGALKDWFLISWSHGFCSRSAFFLQSHVYLRGDKRTARFYQMSSKGEQ